VLANRKQIEEFKDLSSKSKCNYERKRSALPYKYFQKQASFNKVRDKGRTGSALRGAGQGQWGEMTQTMYAYVNK
jgi:hypothetical protein